MSRAAQDVAWIASFFGADVDATQKVGEVDGVALIAVTGPALPFCAVMSAGLATGPIAAIHPQEVLVTVHESQWEAARILVQLTVENLLARGSGLNHGDLIANDRPLLSGTGIVGVYADTNPYMPDEAATRTSTSGELVTSFVTLLPVTADEAASLEGPDRDERERRLRDRFDDPSVDLLDVTRSSALAGAEDMDR